MATLNRDEKPNLKLVVGGFKSKKAPVSTTNLILLVTFTFSLAVVTYSLSSLVISQQSKIENCKSLYD